VGQQLAAARPHPGRKPVPNDEEPLALLSYWVPQSAVRRKIRIDNPGRRTGSALE